MLATRFVSPATASMFLELLKGPRLARELAEVAKIESKHVYCFLRYWIIKGIVVATKVMPNTNLYSLSEEAKKAVGELRKLIEEVIESAKGKKSARKIMDKAEKAYKERFGKEMSDVHRLVLRIFIDQALTKSSPYIVIKPGDETLPQVIKTVILSRYGKDIDVEEITESLKELEMAKLIFIDRRHFKARLDRSLL